MDHQIIEASQIEIPRFEQSADIKKGASAVEVDRFDPDRHEDSPFLTTTLLFIPPKPNPFERAYSALSGSALTPTSFSSGSIGLSRFRFGWTKPLFNCTTQAMSSRTLEALKQCPVNDLVELTQMLER